MAQTDYPEKWSTALQEIHDRLSSPQENIIISGLRALKELLRAYEFEIDEERKPIYQIVDLFFPVLEKLIQYVTTANSPNQILLMHLISKIFFLSNQVTNLLIILQYNLQIVICPSLMQSGRLMPWISFFKGILETSLGAEFETPTEVFSQIDALDKTLCWRLKAIVSQATLKLF